MKITQSTLRKIIREELTNTLAEVDAADRAKHAELMSAAKEALSAGDIQQARSLLNRAAALEQTMRSKAGIEEADLNPEFRKNVREALPRDQLFKLIRDEGLIMHDVNREEFFQWLDKRGFTTKDAVEANRQLIAGWLKKSRAAWVRKNR